MVDLPLLVNIGEQQSLTHGAERSHLSLPSASVRIKTMEESVGTRLLLRSKQGTTLTPAGNVALQHARLVSRPDRKHDGDLLEYGDGLKGHVRLFANATSISGSLPEVLRRYLTENPRVDVDLRERLSDEGVRAVARALPTSRLWRVRPIPTGWRRFLTQPRSWCSSPRQVIRLHSVSGSISPRRSSSTMSACRREARSTAFSCGVRTSIAAPRSTHAFGSPVMTRSVGWKKRMSASEFFPYRPCGAIRKKHPFVSYD